MTDPLALLPLALAARGGRVDAFGAQQLVAAGLTLLGRCAPLVRALSGRRAAILLPAGPPFLIALAACEGRGALLLNPLAAPPEVAYQLADADVGAVLTIEGLYPKLPPDVPSVLLDDAPSSARVLIAGRTLDIDLTSRAALDVAGEDQTPGRDEEAVIVYTSAMAGTPLGAILSHRNLLANARSTVAAADLDASDHSLAILPLSHLFGLTVALNAPLLAGGRVTTMARFHPRRAIEELRTRDVTMLVGVPTVFIALLDALRRDRVPLGARALSLCICGGAPLAPSVQNGWLEATGVELRQGYGLTEAGPVCLFNRVDSANRHGSLGVAFPDVRVSIRDPESGSSRPADSDGEICVAGENVFRGYVRGGEAGLRCREGWLHTGDLGRMDAERYVTFRGVLKAMFTRSGFNIYPREIERVVGAMPGVREVRVRAIPDEVRENEIALDVVGDVTPDGVRAWCRSRLSAYKQPGAVRVRTEGEFVRSQA